MIDFTKLWDPKYLFGPNPAQLSRSDHYFCILAVFTLAVSVIAKVIAVKNPAGSPNRHLWNRLFHLFLTEGLLILLWWGARFENIPWIANHIVALGLLVIFLAWLGAIITYFFTDHRPRQKAWKDENLKRKYLPQ